MTTETNETHKNAHNMLLGEKRDCIILSIAWIHLYNIKSLKKIYTPNVHSSCVQVEAGDLI